MAIRIKVRKKTSSQLVARTRRHFRLRKKVQGSAERPRLCVVKSNRGVTLQLVDDLQSKTLVSSRTPAKVTANKDTAKKAGLEIAEKAKALGIENVVFDRGGFIFHGRIAAAAEGAREGGLKF